MDSPHTIVPTQIGDDVDPAPHATPDITIVDTTAPHSGLGVGDSAYEPGLLDRDEADRALHALRPAPEFGGEIDYQQWHAMPRKPGSRKPLHPLRRLKIAMATPDSATGRVPHYRFPVNDQRRHGVVVPMTPTVDAIRRRVEARTRVSFNHAVVLLYRGPDDCIGFHKDKLLDLDPQAPIVSVSLGAARTYVWRDDMFQPTRQIELRLGHGSLLVLGPKTNAAMYHSVRKPTADDLSKDPSLATGVRVSLTFRRVATFVDADGRLYGQGSAYPELNWPTELRGAHRLDAELAPS